MSWRPEHLRRWYLLGVLLVLVVIYLSLAPQQELPPVGFNDKWEHVLAYFGLTVWFGGLYPVRRYPQLVAGLVVLGGALEFAQGAMQMGRSADLRDFIAGCLGVGIALLLLFLGLRHWATWIERLVGRA